MSGIHALRALVARWLIALALLHVPALGILAVLLGSEPVFVSLMALALAAMPIALIKLERSASVVGHSLAITLVAQTALLVAIFSGHPWQVEMHFYFFAVLAMLTGFCDVFVLLVGAGLIAIHHIFLNDWLPVYLYLGGRDLSRVVVHAGIVVIETAMLVLIVRVITKSFEDALSAKAEASRLADSGTTLQEQLSTTTKRADEFEAALHAFKQEIARSLACLVGASLSLDRTADGVSNAIQTTTAQTCALTSAAANAKCRVDNLADAGRAYLDTMSAISEQTRQSTHKGDTASDEAKETAAAIDDLAAMSEKIDSAVRLIAGIATQTNLLALNATIEAARAGEHGRGFSVVAIEVKSLAAETTQALAVISRLVADIKRSTARSTTAMSSIVTAIHGLNDANAIIADAVDARVLGAATISSDVNSAASDVKRLAAAVEMIEGAARENGQCAGALRAAASEIIAQTNAIRCQVASFAEDLTNMEAEGISAAA